MDLEVREYNGKGFYNIDFRKLKYNEIDAVGESVEVTLLYDTPKTGQATGSDGKQFNWHKFDFAVDGKRAGGFVPEYLKSTQMGVSLLDVLSDHVKGDVLRVTKNQGVVQGGDYAGKTFNMFDVELIRHDDRVDYTSLGLPDVIAKEEQGTLETVTDDEMKVLLRNHNFSPHTDATNIKEIRAKLTPLTLESIDVYLRDFEG